MQPDMKFGSIGRFLKNHSRFKYRLSEIFSSLQKRRKLWGKNGAAVRSISYQV